MMFDIWLPLIRRPRNREDVKSGRMAKQIMPLQENESQLGQSSLFEQVYGFRRSTGVFAFCRPNFHENQALTIESDEIQFAARA